VTFFPDQSAELLGFWYYRERNLPETREERKQILADFLSGRCRKLNLIGNAKQIEDILVSSEWNPTLKDIWIQGIEKLVEHSKKHKAIPLEIDSLEEPKGIAIPVNISVRLRQDRESVIAELNTDRYQITLEIAPDWDLREAVTNFLLKTAN
jgi:hypothetical protein